jgi:hypothetical protein
MIGSIVAESRKIILCEAAEMPKAIKKYFFGNVPKSIFFHDALEAAAIQQIP